MTNKSGFGLAQVKQEGMCFNVNHPEINPAFKY